MLLCILSSLFCFLLFKMSSVQPFQFELTYPPNEEPTESESEWKEESEGVAKSSNLYARVGNTEWCLCGGNCAAMSSADECFCCQKLDASNKKFKSMIECITNHSIFRIVCLETDVLFTALVGVNDARCNPLPDPTENRLVVTTS